MSGFFLSELYSDKQILQHMQPIKKNQTTIKTFELMLSSNAN